MAQPPSPAKIPANSRFRARQIPKSRQMIRADPGLGVSARLWLRVVADAADIEVQTVHSRTCFQEALAPEVSRLGTPQAHQERMPLSGPLLAWHSDSVDQW